MFRLTTKKEIDVNVREECGVYRIFWIKNGKRQSINRIISEDKTGLLYVGHTQGSLRNRLNQFRCSAFSRSTNHSGAKKYRLNRRLNQLIKPDDIFAEVVYIKDSNAFEVEELKKYADIYGEVPPLNG
jgi:hypothetical protein